MTEKFYFFLNIFHKFDYFEILKLLIMNNSNMLIRFSFIGILVLCLKVNKVLAQCKDCYNYTGGNQNYVLNSVVTDISLHIA